MEQACQGFVTRHKREACQLTCSIADTRHALLGDCLVRPIDFSCSASQNGSCVHQQYKLVTDKAMVAYRHDVDFAIHIRNHA